MFITLVDKEPMKSDRKYSFFYKKMSNLSTQHDETYSKVKGVSTLNLVCDKSGRLIGVVSRSPREFKPYAQQANHADSTLFVMTDLDQEDESSSLGQNTI